MCGDFNATVDANHDRYGYTTDNHTQCRSTIQHWFDTDEMVDAVRWFHPDTPIYSWRTKMHTKRVKSSIC